MKIEIQIKQKLVLLDIKSGIKKCFVNKNNIIRKNDSRFCHFDSCYEIECANRIIDKVEVASGKITVPIKTEDKILPDYFCILLALTLMKKNMNMN